MLTSDDSNFELAVKVFRYNLSDDIYERTCQNEYKILKQLNHPHIVNVFDIYKHGFFSSCFLILERAPGVQLDIFVEETETKCLSLQKTKIILK